MKKGAGLTILLVSLILIPLVLGNSLDDEVKKLTHYAEEYESGNINYAQLLIHISSVREELNGMLGVVSKDYGGILKSDQLKPLLGEPTEETKWVWVEGEEQDKKLDSSVPAWKKIIFDGKKIQISLDAWPSIFTKKQFDDDKDEKGEQSHNEGGIKEGDLIYRLNFWIEFKKPEEQLNIEGKINDIKSLAEKFNSDPSQENAENLAKETVNAEKTFEDHLRQNQGKCENLMSSIFGSENQMPNQNMLVQEISFYEGDKFEVIARLEMCDDCEWNWINLDLWLETRGPMPKMDKEMEIISPDQFKDKDSAYYKSEIIRLLNDYKKAAEEQNWGETNKIKQKIWAINEAWNQKSNDAWKEIEEKFKINNQDNVIENQIDNQNNIVVDNKFPNEDNQNNIVVETTQGESNTNGNIVDNDVAPGPQGIVGDSGGEDIVENIITGSFITGNAIQENNKKQSEEERDPYFWIKQDQERRKQERVLRKQNYEERKQFYLNLFSGYDKKEYSFVQIEFKKRLIELFREKGEEICNNNQDDNNNEKIDCDDGQCGGKICGKGTSTITDGNETKETEIDFYCIAGECKAKEEIIEVKEIICGNHICEEDETTENCAEDCSLCPQYAPIECSGRVIFSGTDENNCSLGPTCIKEQTCSANEDCKFLCGEGECVKGKCQVKELIKCSEQECTDETQKTMNCESGESIISSLCSNGLWISTGLACTGVSGGTIEEETEEETEEVVVSEEVVGNQCASLSDCGGENDVCSNGRCVAIPERIEVEEPERINIVEPDKDKIEEDGEVKTQPIFEEEQTSSETETTQPEESPQSETEQAQEPEPISEPTPEPEVQNEPPEEPPTTGAVIFAFFRSLLSKSRIRGAAITEFEAEEGADGTQEAAPSTPVEDTYQEETTNPEPNQDNQQPPQDNQQPPQDNQQPPQDNQQPPQDNQQPYEQQPLQNNQQIENWEDNKNDEKRREEEDERRREEQKQRCTKDCNRPCIEKCIREACGEKMECDIDEESKKCEGSCNPEDTCIKKCIKGEGEWWKEFENKEEFKEQMGGFEAGGNCRTAKGKTEGFIWLGGWGDPFQRIQSIKNKYYSGGEADWCKNDYESLKKRRKEIENSFNEEFLQWFFEDYMANSAENWEQHMSGIYELYWNNVDTSRQMAERMQCLGLTEIPEGEFNLIKIGYETEYGKLEYWEEIKTMKMPGMEEKTEVEVISPYMQVWVFPSKEFMKYEMQEAMKNHEFPGSPEDRAERENEEGLTAKEKESIKNSKKFMKLITKVSEKYDEGLEVAVQFKDKESGEVVFNLYAQVNEDDLLTMEPMLPEEMPPTDVQVEVDFDKIYDMIKSEEKDMGGERIESPPWDHKKPKTVQKVKDVVNGVKMWFKMRSLMNSAKVEPKSAKGDVKSLFKSFFSRMGEDDQGPLGEEVGGEEMEKLEDMEGDLWESEGVLTGEVIKQ